MQFPFETTTTNGRKATVIGTMPDGRLFGFIEVYGGFSSWHWDADGSYGDSGFGITLPLQIKPLTTYRMRNGEIAWTSGRVQGGWIHGLTDDQTYRTWRLENGHWSDVPDHPFDLIEELPPGTTE